MYMLMQNSMKLSAAVQKKKLSDDAENNTAVDSAGRNEHI